MVGTILLVITEGYDDMAYLSSQVILEEAGNDVISASPAGGALKGETSSVMTVTIDDALEQDLDYLCLVIVGGDNLSSIDNLGSLVNDFHSAGKVIAAFESGVDFLQSSGLNVDLSSDSDIVVSNNVITMKEAENCEEFVESLVKLL